MHLLHLKHAVVHMCEKNAAKKNGVAIYCKREPAGPKPMQIVKASENDV
jgi:hypothetical protein